MTKMYFFWLVALIFRWSLALTIEYPREGMIENSTHGIFALWSLAATDNVTPPIVLYLNQTAYNGDTTSEESGPIEMGLGEYTFASPAVTLSTYNLLIIADNQTVGVGNFKVSVNWTLNEQTPSSTEPTSSDSDSSATLLASSDVDGGATHPDSSLSLVTSASNAELQTRSKEDGQESAMVTPEPKSQEGDGRDTKLAVGVGIASFILLAIIGAGVIWYFRGEMRLGSLNPPPRPMELGTLSGVPRLVRTNVAELHAQTLGEVH